MEVHFSPEIEMRLVDLARQSGRAAAELVQDAVAVWVDDLGETGVMLDGRYDDIKSGKVELIPGDEAFARLRERIDARRANSA